LGAFADHLIDIHFRLWQDGAFTLLNMFVDDIEITGPDIYFFDDVEAGEGGWTTDGWTITEGRWNNGWDMTVFDFKGKHNGMELGGIWEMDVDFATQSGMVKVPATPYKSGRMSVAVVANHADHIIGQAYAMGAY